MAIYCLRVTPISRGSGRSAVGAAAYRAGEKLHNEHDGITNDYTRRKSAVQSAEYRSGENDFVHRKDIVHSEIILPENAPEGFSDRQTLWNAVEKSEKNSNARTAREVLVALPNELKTEQQIEIVRDYVQRNFVDKGMCADFSIHSGHIHDRHDEKYPLEGLAIRKENPHAHIQITVRPINKDGAFNVNKSKKEYILDKNGNKIKLPSGEWKSRKIPLTDWDKVETLEKWRENWAVTVNKKFEQLAISERIDHRTLKAQGIDREPTKHIGVKAWNLEKKGIPTEQLKEHREILARNKAKQPENVAKHMFELKQNYCTLDNKISALKQEISDAQREINSSEFTAESISERAEHIENLKNNIDKLKTQREKMGFFANKKDIDRQIQQLEKSREQAENTFKREYEITPEQAGAEIQQLENRARSLGHLQEKLQEKLKPLIEEKDIFEYEYMIQNLLAKISPDRQRINDELAELSKKTLTQKEPPQIKNERLRSERVLDTATEQNFQNILIGIIANAIRNVNDNQSQQAEGTQSVYNDYETQIRDIINENRDLFYRMAESEEADREEEMLIHSYERER